VAQEHLKTEHAQRSSRHYCSHYSLQDMKTSCTTITNVAGDVEACFAYVLSKFFFSCSFLKLLMLCICICLIMSTSDHHILSARS